jgi:retinol dehydrogenase-14
MSNWSIDGKTVLVTGGTSGIGFEAAISLARLGARITIVGRDAAKAERSAALIGERSGREIAALACDFSSQASIRKLAAEVLARYPRLDVLVNNAGGVWKSRSLTVDGIESTFAVNHLGYFLLTNLLLDRIVASGPARIVNVASIGHRRASMDFADLGYEKGYFVMKAYMRSKLGNVLFTNELARRLAGRGVTVNSLHPGSVATNIWSGAPGWAKPIITLLLRPFFISAAKGAERVVQLATSPDLDAVTGAYFEDGRAVTPSRLALDEALAKRLWTVSAELVGSPGI